MPLTVHVGKRISPRRIMLYGVEGIGKSTFASMAPAPIFIKTEEGVNNIDCHSMPADERVCESLDEFRYYVQLLRTEPHDYKTLAIDTADWLEKLVHADVCRAKNCESIESIDYGKGYAFALVQWSEIRTALDALRVERGMNVILLSHAKIEKFASPEADTYDRYSPDLQKLASAMLREWCDEVLFATYKVYTKTSDEGFNRKRNQGIGIGERVLKTTARPAYQAKNRLDLPDELPLNWDAFATFLAA